jgi:hypothetical protein
MLNLSGARDVNSFLLPNAEQLAMQLTLRNLMGEQQPQQAPQAAPPQMGGQPNGDFF